MLFNSIFKYEIIDYLFETVKCYSEILSNIFSGDLESSSPTLSEWVVVYKIISAMFIFA